MRNQHSAVSFASVLVLETRHSYYVVLETCHREASASLDVGTGYSRVALTLAPLLVLGINSEVRVAGRRVGW